MLAVAPTTELIKPKPRPKLEVADIFRAHGAEYLRSHRVTTEQRRVMNAIIECRTAALGGHVEECNECGHQRIAYNSCRNRHCPKCQSLKQALWVEERVADLLPIEYFHVVFTLPHELNELARWEGRKIYDLLFASATVSLKEYGRRELGGELGITAVLHTWGQKLDQHIHVHCIVTGGALSEDGQSFRRSRQGFLVSVEDLGKAYRDKYCEGLGKWCVEASESGQEGLSESLEGIRKALRDRTWVVYVKKPMAGAEQVISYLGRYTQRVAISNSRLIEMSDGRVRFSWKDYRSAKEENKETSLRVKEFIRRYLQHVLPSGYVRIRHYGMLASRGREARLARCRELLNAQAPEKGVVGETIQEKMLRLTGRDLGQCERCGKGQMEVIGKWKAGESPPPVRAERERLAA